MKSRVRAVLSSSRSLCDKMVLLENELRVLKVMVEELEYMVLTQEFPSFQAKQDAMLLQRELQQQVGTMEAQIADFRSKQNSR